MQLKEISNQIDWDEYVSSHDYGHPLQLWGWGEAKRFNNWRPYRLAISNESGGMVGFAQVLSWTVPYLGWKIAYIPRGPVVSPESTGVFLDLIAEWSRQNKMIYLRIEPSWVDREMPLGWINTKNHIQLPETYTIDLTQSETDIYSVMSRKHRQYIRKSERSNIEIKTIDPTSTVSILDVINIYKITAQRAGFGLHEDEYYIRLADILGDNNRIYVAYIDGLAVAFLWLIQAGKCSYELYGGVTDVGQENKANYILKWHAISAARDQGNWIYDFNGRLNDGVSRFKDGFGPNSTDWIGTWDYPINKPAYRIWEYLWPSIKPLGRKLIKMIKQ